MPKEAVSSVKLSASFRSLVLASLLLASEDRVVLFVLFCFYLHFTTLRPLLFYIFVVKSS